MGIYVDDFFAPMGRMKMCHMMADSLEELHAMADKLGLKREWFQDGRFPHYDICKSNREKAISLGATVISSREMVTKFSSLLNRRK